MLFFFSLFRFLLPPGSSWKSAGRARGKKCSFFNVFNPTPGKCLFYAFPVRHSGSLGFKINFVTNFSKGKIKCCTLRRHWTQRIFIKSHVKQKQSCICFNMEDKNTGIKGNRWFYQIREANSPQTCISSNNFVFFLPFISTLRTCLKAF